MIIIIALILSIVLHEMAHGYAAHWLGDPTARLQGRLSLNPLVHLDPLGSILVPALLFFGNAGFIFGWAKPVPYNPYNLSDQRYGEAKVAAAQSYRAFTMWIEQYGLIASLLFIFVFINLFWAPFSIAVFSVFELFTGMGGL